MSHKTPAAGEQEDEDAVFEEMVAEFKKRKLEEAMAIIAACSRPIMQFKLAQEDPRVSHYVERARQLLALEDDDFEDALVEGSEMGLDPEVGRWFSLYPGFEPRYWYTKPREQAWQSKRCA